MKLHDLRPAPGSRKSRQRVGRGMSAGQGKTSGRGQKGAGARQGSKVPRAFEGGQMPLTQRLPKLRGFNNRWRQEYVVVNVSKLNRFAQGAIVDGVALHGKGLVAHTGDRIKLLAAGEVKVAVTVRVHRASDKARQAVEAVGGRVELLEERIEKGLRAARRAERQKRPRGGPRVQRTVGAATPTVTTNEEAPPST